MNWYKLFVEMENNNNYIKFIFIIIINIYWKLKNIIIYN